MKIVMLSVGSLEANCYLVASEQGNVAVIDPGAEAGRILEYLKTNQLTAKKILLTHGHFDHIGGVKELMEATEAKLVIHEADVAMLSDGRKNLSAAFGKPYPPMTAERLVQDGDIVTLDELSFTVLHTPGHTPGSVCYLMGETLFSGDTLFRDSIGRIDFPGGDMREMSASLQRLQELPENTAVLSGHGAQTTMGREKQYNPYLRILE